jgi:glutathione peroxidase
MKSVRMMAWFSSLFLLAACDIVDPNTLNVDVTKNEAGPTSILQPSGGKNKKVDRIYDFTLFDIDEQPVSLSKFRGKVLLLVNTASRCGYTPQYEQLQQLYEQYQSRGLEILAFPSKDFGGQELETNEAIATFCYTRYSVNFPLFAKTKVRGENKHPLYRYLTEISPFPGEVRWNFEKYLVDRKGSVIARYYSSVLPLSQEIISDLERALAIPS